MNKPPGCNARTLLQKGQPVRRKTAIEFEENTRGRGTVSLRICLTAKQGEEEPALTGFTNHYTTGMLGWSS